MDRNSVLVIIDMQPGFPASQDVLTVYAVGLLIEQAREAGLPILVVEYDAHEMGETLEKLQDKLRGYDRCWRLDKSKSDGGSVVVRKLQALGLVATGSDSSQGSNLNLVICGVNSDGCVLATVNSLVGLLPGMPITLPQDACNSVSGKDCSVWHEEFTTLPNVHVDRHAAASLGEAI